MQRAITSLLIILFAIGIISYLSQTSVWFFAVLISLVVLIIILFSFFTGVYLARDMMQRGADIAISSQEVNDKWDMAKSQSLAQFGRELIKLKSGPAPRQYPILPSMAANVFEIESEEIE